VDDTNAQKADFKAQLLAYKEAIDEDIKRYAAHVEKTTEQQFGAYPSAVTGTYLDMLSRGGKRIRGALAMVGYEMCGGQDREMILRAATALEMIHAYILIIDDIQDRSKLRRNKPTVHEALASFHRKNELRGDAGHTGVSLALNAALAGAHAAQMLFAGLNVDPELRIKVIGIVNLTMLTTAHGQTADIMNELTHDVSKTDVEQALEWKTAHYTILNPLCVGMALAGAGCDDTNAIRDYALNTGRAFQITDDIIGIFGDDSQTGKSNMDDIKEGKRTLLTLYALEHASPGDRNKLLAALGNESITEAEFAEVKRIITDTGALQSAREAAQNYAGEALKALDAYAERWNTPNVTFLRDLVRSLLGRVA
jgi:geranylgeranyl diphosphate synthase type I